MEVDTGYRIDPVTYLVGIGQYAEATRAQLLRLTIWLATSMRSWDWGNSTGRPGPIHLGPGPVERQQRPVRRQLSGDRGSDIRSLQGNDQG